MGQEVSRLIHQIDAEILVVDRDVACMPQMTSRRTTP